MKVSERVFLFAWTKMPSYVVTALTRCLRLLFRKDCRDNPAENSSLSDRVIDEPRTRHLPRLKVYWWRPAFGGFTNFGDEMGPLLLERLFGFTSRWAPPETCDAVVIGSVLEKVCATRRESPPVVWGAGFIGEGRAVSQRVITAAAVRGRLTAGRFGIDDSLVTGDPGLLCSELLDRMPDKQYHVGIVLHHSHNKFDVASLFADDVRNVCTIDVTMPPMQVIQKIAACETILSTSLHGLVVADSLGIPNQWITMPRPLFGGSYKFNDYYSVFTCDIPQPRAVDSRQTIDCHTINQLIERYRRPGLDSIKQRLVACLPEVLM